MGWLEKKQIVLQYHPDQQSENYRYFEFKAEENERTDGYYMTRACWDEMGNPLFITVTVVPGKQLDKAD